MRPTAAEFGEKRKIWAISTEGFAWDDLRTIFRGFQRMANVPNGVEKLPKISTAYSERNMNASSRVLKIQVEIRVTLL